MSANTQSVDGLLEIVGEMKDRLWDLEQQQRERSGPPVLAPGTQPGARWAPCDREEAAFYAALTQYA